MPDIPKIKPRKIGTRILVLVGTCVAIVVITFGQIYAVRQEETIRALSDRDMQRLMESVTRGIEGIMLPGQASIAQSYAERLKTVAPETGINVTTGLPFPRTSPDHG